MCTGEADHTQERARCVSGNVEYMRADYRHRHRRARRWYRSRAGLTIQESSLVFTRPAGRVRGVSNLMGLVRSGPVGSGRVGLGRIRRLKKFTGRVSLPLTRLGRRDDPTREKPCNFWLVTAPVAALLAR